MTKRSPIRVVVADLGPLFTLEVRALAAADAGISVVGEAVDGAQALKIVEHTRPDVLLLGMKLRGIPALDVLTRLRSMNLQTRVVVVAKTLDPGEKRIALMRGARGVLLEHSAGELLVKCLYQVMNGQYWLGRDDVGELVDALRNAQSADDPESLSPRQLDIVRAVLTGAGNKDIAAQLGIGEQTVKNQLRRIFAKLGVANRVQLAVLALERHLTPEDTERAPEK